MRENLTIRLFEELYDRARVSMKSREKFSRKEDYFRVKGERESSYIEQVGFFDVFESASLDEIKAMQINSEPPHYWDEATLLEILINSLKRLIDANEERQFDERIGLIYEKYVMLKTHFPYLPVEDAFKDYMA
jgi:hypothetical protein